MQFTAEILIHLCYIFPASLLRILNLHSVLTPMQPQCNMLACHDKLICQRAVEKWKWKRKCEQNLRCFCNHAWPCTKWSHFSDGQQQYLYWVRHVVKIPQSPYFHKRQLNVMSSNLNYADGSKYGIVQNETFPNSLALFCYCYEVITGKQTYKMQQSHIHNRWVCMSQ